jgi:hypothetical protein
VSPVPYTVPLTICALLGCVVAAAILLFPPLWRGDWAQRWLWHRIIAAIILAGIGLLTPVRTHAVKLDMPMAKDLK